MHTRVCTHTGLRAAGGTPVPQHLGVPAFLVLARRPPCLESPPSGTAKDLTSG